MLVIQLRTVVITPQEHNDKDKNWNTNGKLRECALNAKRISHDFFQVFVGNFPGCACDNRGWYMWITVICHGLMMFYVTCEGDSFLLWLWISYREKWRGNGVFFLWRWKFPSSFFSQSERMRVVKCLFNMSTSLANSLYMKCSFTFLRKKKIIFLSPCLTLHWKLIFMMFWCI